MTTDRQMEMAYTAQQQVIAAVYGMGESDLAGRLERCMTARLRGTAEVVGRTSADLSRACGADDR
jgi:hypothetical protein